MMTTKTITKATLSLFMLVVFTLSCSKDDLDDTGDTSPEITATFQFNSGETIDFAFTHKTSDIIQPHVYGPNENGHYKLWLRGEKVIEGMVYIINIYVTMPEDAVRDYSFGTAWQWHDEGPAAEIHVGVQEVDNLLNLKQYYTYGVSNINNNGVTVTSLTDSHVKGTFSGVANYTESETVTITHGKFDIDINRGDWEE